MRKQQGRNKRGKIAAVIGFIVAVFAIFAVVWCSSGKMTGWRNTAKTVSQEMQAEASGDLGESPSEGKSGKLSEEVSGEEFGKSSNEKSEESIREKPGKFSRETLEGVSEADSQEVTLGIAGDLCLDETCQVMKHMRSKGKGIAGCIDPRLIKIMRENDYTLINNEFSISDRGKPMPGKLYTFRAPERNTKILRTLGVDAVSLANNHIYDYGRTAFLDTLRALKKAKIAYVGGGKNHAEAKKPIYLECGEKKIAVVAATRAEKYIMTPEAGKNTPGVFRTYDDREYVREIRRAGKRADVVIAFVHWGTEYSTKLEEAQKQQAKDYIDAGADVVVGAHTHCLQGVGYYKKKPIFYSLGNFWFNEKTLYTTLLQLTIRQDGDIEAQMLPCLQSGKETHLLTGKKQVRRFVRHVNGISTNGRIGKIGKVHEK